MNADVLDPRVVVPLTATTLPFFERTLYQGQYTPAFVMDQLAAERKLRNEIRRRVTKQEDKKARAKYPTLLNVQEARTEDFEEWYDLKPSRLSRVWNWFKSRGRRHD
jgi:hypothetical protein